MKKLISLLFTTLFLISSVFAADSTVPEEKLNYSFIPDQVQSLDVNFSAGKVTIRETRTNEINITITKDYDAPAVNAKINKGVLSVKTGLFSNYSKKLSILIEVPVGKVFDEINVTVFTAATYLKGVEAKDVNVTSGGGLVNVENSQISGHMKIAGASGNLSVENTKAFWVTLSAVAGEVNVNKVDSALVRAETANGKIIFQDVDVRKFEIQSMNGSVEAQFEKMPQQDSFVKTNTGNIDLLFPKGKGYKAVATTLNGQFIDNNTNITGAQCDGLVSQFKKGEVEIKVTTRNGKATISSK